MSIEVEGDGELLSRKNHGRSGVQESKQFVKLMSLCT